MTMIKKYKKDSEDCLTICLKYLLFIFNIIFWLAGAGVLLIGIWTLNEKREYLSLLPSSTFAVSACILVFAGCLVIVTGFLGCCAVVREQKSALLAYFSLLLLIFLIELVAGVLACIYYRRLSGELTQHLNRAMLERYGEPAEHSVTRSIDRLQQHFKCCGSNNATDWQDSAYIRSPASDNRLVPDSCCKTVTEACGSRDHPSNIYKVEGGCLTVLEQVLVDHLLIMGAVGIGVACLQLIGAVTTACFICVLIKEEEGCFQS
ncbi:tetraspanin-11 [Leucoraja erinacea]|uniref:tetraspanin-11 n=1 Tax=Leucoraja erinaceus TaxID=7782 RepID=UPI002454FA76|nr:tetraspanin-11 [Leucoraja erinacea]XP_055506445.1 tetraspanin-11 [Leucoraja erinacea]XP_055506446.1 tetraspanin-11 [Leucoraja erinacea]